MNAMIIQYRTRPEAAADNRRLVEAVLRAATRGQSWNNSPRSPSSGWIWTPGWSPAAGAGGGCRERSRLTRGSDLGVVVAA
jgi:hypothetical protein